MFILKGEKMKESEKYMHACIFCGSKFSLDTDECPNCDSRAYEKIITPAYKERLLEKDRKYRRWTYVIYQPLSRVLANSIHRIKLIAMDAKMERMALERYERR